MLRMSIISLTWNSEKYIKKMLDTLIANLESASITYEIMIVDNGSTDQTADILKEYEKKFDALTVLYLDKNSGTTKPRNLAIKHARYEYILLIDSDTTFNETDFHKLLDSYSEIKSERIGLVQPQLVHTHGEIQTSALKFPTFKNKLARFLGYVHTPYEHNKTQQVDYCISAAWLVKKEVFKDVGYLDEKIFYAPEDAEFCKRLKVNNYEVWYYPEVQITHHYQRITSKKKFSKMWFSHLKGLIHFWLKYRKTA